MKTLAICFLFISTVASAQYTGKHDPLKITDVSAPQSAYQIVPPDTYSRIATDEEATKNIKEQLGVINQSLKEIRADVKILMDTNVLVQFFIACARLLIPGLLIAGFGIWLTRFLSKKPPTRRAKASAQG